MKNTIKNILWYIYYLWDMVKCLRKRNTTRTIDAQLASEIVEHLKKIGACDTIIIFACYEKQRNDIYFKHFVEKNTGKVIIFINNTNIERYAVEAIGDGNVWVNRPNFMRDIGAYKVGVTAIHMLQSKALQQVVLINDSVYILRDELYNFLNYNGGTDVLGHSYSTTPYPHVRSYFLVIKSSIVSDLYHYLNRLPVTRSRYAAVIHGEVGMSKWVFLKSSISLLKHYHNYRVEKDRSDLKIIDIVDVFKNTFLTDKLLFELYENLKPITRLNNALSDPYRIESTSSSYCPDLIKREVFEKSLATEAKIMNIIQAADLPVDLKNLILRNILIVKKPKNMVTKIKMMIGEI